MLNRKTAHFRLLSMAKKHHLLKLPNNDNDGHDSIDECDYTLSFFSSSYEPELFPGLIYRMVKPRIVLLIFVSGKVVLTGKKCIP